MPQVPAILATVMLECVCLDVQMCVDVPAACYRINRVLSDAFVRHCRHCLRQRHIRLHFCLQARGLVTNLAHASRNASDAGIVRSVLACGFYPLVGCLLPGKAKGNDFQKGPSAKGKGMLVTAKNEKVCRP